jgi:hypothetical protein
MHSWVLHDVLADHPILAREECLADSCSEWLSHLSKKEGKVRRAQAELPKL